MSERIPVIIKSQNGFQLHGIFQQTHIEHPKKETIIILSPGIKSRVAPHRMYVKLSEKFTKLGFNVLRFDPEGIGDSEGEIEEDLAADVLASIEIGRFVTSTISAMDWLEHEKNGNEFILAGLCGGAITGLLAAAQDQRVKGLLALGIPAVSSAMKRIDPYKYISKGELEGLKTGYIKNLFSFKRWIRFLTFQSDYKMIIKSMLSSKTTTAKSKSADNNSLDGGVNNSNLNPLFYDGMFKVLRSSRKICLIFSGMDRLYWEFDEKFFIPYKSEIEQYSQFYEVSIVEDANHIFSYSKWEKDMHRIATNWLNTHYN